MLGINSPFVYSCAAPSFTSGSRFLLPLANTEVTQRHTDSAENTGISCQCKSLLNALTTIKTNPKVENANKHIKTTAYATANLYK